MDIFDIQAEILKSRGYLACVDDAERVAHCLRESLSAPSELAKDEMELAYSIGHKCFTPSNPRNNGRGTFNVDDCAALIQSSFEAWSVQSACNVGAIKTLSRLYNAVLALSSSTPGKQTYFEASPLHDPECARRWEELNSAQIEARSIIASRQSVSEPSGEELSNKEILLAIQAVVDLWDELPLVALMPADDFEREMDRRELLCGDLLTSIRTLLASRRAPTDEKALRKPLAWFASEMERKLKENDWKKPWPKMSWKQLIDQWDMQGPHLVSAIIGGDKEEVIRRAVNIANYAMMFADKAHESPKEQA